MHDRQGLLMEELAADTDAHTLEVRLDPGLRGTMLLAYYVDLG